MTQGRMRQKRGNQALKEFKVWFEKEMTDEEKKMFHAAFGMGWKQGKKRQRQLTNKEEKKE